MDVVRTHGVIRERFLREARATATLKSEHITKIFDVGVDPQGTPYIVMERLFGSDLEGVLAQDGAQDERTAVEYVIQACHALGDAHANGIVHRDLKPENLFLTRRDDGRAMVKVGP